MGRLFLRQPGSIGYSLTSEFQWCCLISKGSPAATQHVVSVEASSMILHGTSRLICFTVMIH